MERSCLIFRKVIIFLFLLLSLNISCRSESQQQDRKQQNISAEERFEIAKTFDRISTSERRYRQDGSTFQNREHRLPEKPRGYYREYTVETPGSRDRGARRLVLGKDGEAYYTNDHYNTFLKIDPKDYSK